MRDNAPEGRFGVSLEPDAKALLAEELRAGERVLWSSMPETKPRSFEAINMFGFGCFWTGLIILIFVPAGLLSLFAGSDATAGSTAGETATGPTSLLALVGIVALFMTPGLIMLRTGWIAMTAPAREIYAITTQRGLLISPYARHVVKSIAPHQLLGATRKDRKGKPSTLSFEAGRSWLAMGGFPSTEPTLSFKNISNARKVEDLIYRTFGQGATP